MASKTLNRISSVDDTDIRIDDPPELAPLVARLGVASGHVEFDRLNKEWVQNFNKVLSEKFYTLKK